MDWEEIIISALKNEKYLNKSLKKAAKVAPKEIAPLLQNFPEKIHDISKIHTYPKVISLLYFHLFSIEGEFFKEHPPEKQITILESSIDASLKASYLSEMLGEKGLQALYLGMAGVSLYQLHKFSEAEETLTESLEIYRNLLKENPQVFTPPVAKTLHNLGNLYRVTQRFLKAEKAYKTALELYRDIPKEHIHIYNPDIAGTLNNLGNLYWDTKKSDEAEKYYLKALKIRKELAKKNPEAYTHYVAGALNNLGNIYRDTQRFLKAEKLYKEALREYRSLTKENSYAYAYNIAATLNNLGNLYSSTGRFPQAEKIYKETLKIRKDLAKENPDVYTPNVAMALRNIGDFYWDTKKYSEAEKCFTKSLQLYKSLAKEYPDIYMCDVATALNSLGNFYSDTQKFFEAETIYKKVLEIGKELAKKNPEAYTHYVAGALNNLGILYTITKKVDEAEKMFKKALKIRKRLAEENPQLYVRDVAETMKNLGNLYGDKNKFSEAEKALGEALEIVEDLSRKDPDAYTLDAATALHALGTLYIDMERFSEAEKALEEAFEKYKRVGLWFYAAKAVGNLSRIRPDKTILEQSRRLLELAILFSKENKYKYTQKGSNESIYLRMLEQDMGGLGVLEALRDPEQLSLSWDWLSQNELERLQEDVESQRILVENVLNNLVSYNESIPGKIPKDALFIYIQGLLNYVLFFVIRNNEIKKYKCKKEFLKMGDNLLFNLQIQRGAAQKTDDLTFVAEKFDDLSRQWSSLLPEEIKGLIQENDHIVFSPDNYCSYFPLGALQVDGVPLCIEKTVVRATSLYQFLDLIERKPHLDSSLVVGNPWTGCDKEKLIYQLPSGSECFEISFLEGAHEETKALEEKLPDATVLLGQDAIGERFLSEISKHSLIHFSGHGSMGRILFLAGPLQGFPPPFEPEEFSDLRKAQRHEGIKTINMMEEWHPVTDLDLFDIKLTEGAVVFLNACETGQHKYAGGGYYQGLPAVFLKNGAHSVISSLVPIFDEHSKEFALHFYEHLLDTHSVSKSLKKARIWARNTDEAQIFWIPYIHYGSP